ncbi:MAG: class I SAM-dependent methyltransferase [Loktanella sp.]|nr:class I SAM-dependent methyltransferase [Loktanella sp.]
MSAETADGTQKFYSSNAATYAQSGGEKISQHLNRFLAELPARARILELGCGGGRDAKALIAAGHDVEPTDGIPEIARQAEELLGIPVKVLRFEELEARDAYDAIWANASLLHVARTALPDVLRRVRTALKPGGLHLATYKGGGQEGLDRHGRYFNYLTPDDVVQMYEHAGDWDIVSLVEYVEAGYDKDTPEPWTAIMVKKYR